MTKSKNTKIKLKIAELIILETAAREDIRERIEKLKELVDERKELEKEVQASEN